ncbi:MAG: serine/threonine-protein kinase [Kineosporiaceae bacterium]
MATVAGFELLAELGRGAASQVFQARRCPDDGTQYAVKLLTASAGVTASRQVLVAFRREAALLASVDHPGLPAIHEVGESEGMPYLVMDLVDGTSLAALIASGPLSPERVIAVAADVVGPLGAVHRRGLVHRDLKPDNIMVRPSGRAQLIDFGLATRGATGTDQGAAGTLAYAPPEQTGMLARPVDHRSDLYSLGVVLFESLTGHLPFAADDVGELLRLHAVAAPPDLLDLVPRIPVGLAAAVARLLAKDPDDRYQSAHELAVDLARLGAVGEPADDPTSVGSRPPLSGRARESAQLTERWRAAGAGSGSVAVIRGAPGEGKSRLAEELADRVVAEGRAVLYGKSSPMIRSRSPPARRGEGYLGRPRDAGGRAGRRPRAGAGRGAAGGGVAERPDAGVG